MSNLLSHDEERTATRKYPFTRILSANVGIVDAVDAVPIPPEFPQFRVASASLGNLSLTFPNITDGTGRLRFDAALGGAAADLDPEVAWMKALAEAFERYCCFALNDDDVVTATALELGSSALDLDSIPRMSTREYALANCPFVPADPKKPIRWVKGYSLTHAVPKYVPVVMTHLNCGATANEKFWSEISTGVAAHTDFSTALVSALCEVIERDAIALTWLARLPLPRIEIDEVEDAELAINLSVLRNSRVEQVFFDATTDLGVPTVYAIQMVDSNPEFSQLVGCSTSASYARSCAKTIREGVPALTVLQAKYKLSDLPSDVSDFKHLEDGAVYMGHPAQRNAFDFLLKSDRTVALSALSTDLPGDAPGQARNIIDRLRRANMEAILVDLSTEEARAAGMWVLRVVVPQLVPMSPIYAGRYLGHPRLYEYPPRAGYASISESDINPYPQPFA
jgi:ribosomal protein S12 methylthiotransferase accessory factor